MRVSNYDLNTSMSSKLMKIQSEVSAQQIKIASGKAYTDISDDPIAANKTMLLKSSENRVEQYLSNVSDAETFIKEYDTILKQAIGSVQNAREAALTAKNGTYGAEDKKTFANSIESVITQLVSLGNTKYLGKNVFSGEKTQTESFTYDGTTLTYNGDNKPLTMNVSSKMNMSVSDPGNEVFEGVINSLIELKKQVESGTVTDIETALGGMDGELNNLIDKQASVGVRMSTLETLTDNYKQTKLSLTEQRTKSESAEMTELITQYTQTKTLYEATIQATIKMNEMSLINFM